MTIKCDVLVVGAGPAGSMVAKTTAERGIDTLLIEEHEEIGIPVQCGEGINKFLFQDTGIKKDDSFIKQKITGTKVYFYDEVYELDSDQWQGYTIDRKIFDKYLAKLAESAGARVMTNAKATGMIGEWDKKIVEIKLQGKIKRIKAKIVVGAGGFGCKVGIWADIRKPWRLSEFSKCLEYEIRGLDLQEHDKFHIAFGEEFPRGYGWVFPKGKDVANIGVGIDPRSNIREAFDFFINKYPVASEILGNDYVIQETRGGCIPMSGPLSVDEVVSDGVILVGDAAGMVDPVTGEGIISGMLSGIAAGEMARKALEKEEYSGKFLLEYSQIWRDKRYLGSKKLGAYLDAMKEIKNEFYYAFSNRSEKNKREELMRLD